MARPSKYSPELRERAVRMIFDHAAEHSSQRAAMRSVAEKLGCIVEALEREDFELRRRNEILKKAAAFFAQAELDRRAK